MADKLRITLTRSLIGRPSDQRDTVRSLGLRRLNHTVEKEDTPGTRGMVRKVRHLVTVEVVDGPAEPAGAPGTSA